MLSVIPRFQPGSCTVVIRGLRSMDMKSIPKIWDFLNKFVPVVDLDVRSRRESNPSSTYASIASNTDNTEVWVYLPSEAEAARLVDTLNRKEGLTAILSLDVAMLEEFHHNGASSSTTPAPPQSAVSPSLTVDDRNSFSNTSEGHPASALGHTTAPNATKPSVHNNPTIPHHHPANNAMEGRETSQTVQPSPPANNCGASSTASASASSVATGNGICPDPAPVTQVRVTNVPSYANEEWFNDIAITLKLAVADGFLLDPTSRSITLTYAKREEAHDACVKLSAFRLGSVSLNALLVDNRSVTIHGFIEDSCTDLLLYQLWAPYGAIECVRTLSPSVGRVTFVHVQDARNLLALSASSDGFSVMVRENQEMVLTVTE